MQADTNSIIQTWIFGGQLVAYSATFFYLFKSLNAQKVANDLTNKKFIFDVKPFFSISHRPYPFNSVQTSDVFNVSYLIKLERNVAKDFLIKVESKDFYQSTYHDRKLAIIPVGEQFEILHGEISLALVKLNLKIHIYFTDEIGNCYSQLLHGDVYDLRLDPPISCTKQATVKLS